MTTNRDRVRHQRRHLAPIGAPVLTEALQVGESARPESGAVELQAHARHVDESAALVCPSRVDITRRNDVISVNVINAIVADHDVTVIDGCVLVGPGNELLEVVI